MVAFSPQRADKSLFVMQAIFNYYTVKKKEIIPSVSLSGYADGTSMPHEIQKQDPVWINSEPPIAA